VLLRQQLVRQWSTYQLIAATIERFKHTQELSSRTRQLLTSLERSVSGTGVYRVLCQLNKIIMSLGHPDAKSLCIDHSKSVDMIMSSTRRPPMSHCELSTGWRVQATRSAVIFSVYARILLRRSVLDIARLRSGGVSELRV